MTEQDLDLLRKWKSLANDYAAVPGREKWDEYSRFIYQSEPDLIRILDGLTGGKI